MYPSIDTLPKYGDLPQCRKKQTRGLNVTGKDILVNFTTANLQVWQVCVHTSHKGSLVSAADFASIDVKFRLPKTVIFLLIVSVCVHVPMSLRARTAAPDDWL